jgi:hypothetical protein
VLSAVKERSEAKVEETDEKSAGKKSSKKENGAQPCHPHMLNASAFAGTKRKKSSKAKAAPKKASKKKAEKDDNDEDSEVRGWCALSYPPHRR